tara:strand:+ start:294 stop:986 length:693 start_codon:yes stop_codon:yes gene_type:complete
MSKISTYANSSPVLLTDKMIGTNTAGTPANATKNFLVSDLLSLFQSSITLQNVLDAGNTATQSIVLTGAITQTGDFGITGNLTQSGGAITLGGTVKDYSGTLGTNDKILVSDASGQVTWQDRVSGKAVNNLGSSITSYQLASSDANGVIVATNSSPVTIDIVPNALTAIPIGTTVTIIQEGAGQVTVQGSGATTINASGGKIKSAAQYAVMNLVKTQTDIWYLSGEERAV